MMRQTVGAVWVCAVMLGATFATLSSKILSPRADLASKEAVFETIKLPPFSVPMISEGEVKGYALARFAAVVSKREASAKRDAYIIDEVFRSLYGLGPSQLQREEAGQIANVTKGIVERVNTRAGLQLVRELLVLEWTWVDKRDARN
jgi:hypothetical protein